MNEIAYSAKQVALLVDVAKVLLPVCTGFLVLAAKTLLWTRESGIKLRTSEKILWMGAFTWATVSAALWIAVLALMVDCFHPFERYDKANLALSPKLLNWEWGFAQTSAQIALITFGFGLAFYAVVILKAYMRKGEG